MIKLMQLLCPSRHCFMAIAFDDEKVTEVEANLQLGMSAREHMQAHGPACALCGSLDFHVETRRTRFTTIDEAMPMLASCEFDQLGTRDHFTGPQSLQ